MKRFVSFINLFLMLTLLTIISCKKDSTTAVSGDNIDQYINTNSQYSLFAYAVKKTGVDIFTKGGGPFTFFVPTNEAFGRLTFNGNPINSEVAIDKVDSVSLAIILINHFKVGSVSYPEIPAGPNAATTMQSGGTVYQSKNKNGAFINGWQLLDQGKLLSNGYVYGINGVLLPNFVNPLSWLTGGGNFKLMLQAIAKTATTSSFTTNPTTVFAIPDNIMVANGYDSVTIANLSGANLTTLSNILKYHTIADRIYLGDWKTANYPTRLSKTATLSVTPTSGNLAIKGSNNAAPFSLTSANISCTTGVVYAINGMLKP